MTFRYVHTNLVAHDWKKVSEFYQRVFQCKPISQSRDLKGEWLDKLTAMQGAHILGEHLLLPGYSEDHPTLEIFSYNKTTEGQTKMINRPGFAHLAFEVNDVRETLKEVIAAGGGQIGEVVETIYPGNIKGTIVYATDVEGNIVELQNWEKL